MWCVFVCLCVCVVFEQVTADEVVIAYHMIGLTAGLHAFHVHETANFTSGCASTGERLGIDPNWGSVQCIHYWA